MSDTLVVGKMIWPGVRVKRSNDLYIVNLRIFMFLHFLRIYLMNEKFLLKVEMKV